MRGRLVTTISLKPLSPDGVAEMIGAMAGEPAPPSLVTAVHGQSEGNPFFAEEIYLHLAESGLILDDKGRLRPDVRLEELELPESVRLVIGERLGHLSRGTRQVLAAAAVSGRVFETDVLEQVVEGTDDLADALDEAERAHLLTADVSAGPHTGLAMGFAHELIRQALLAELSPFRRQRLHARTAEAIELVHAGDLDEQAADLAYHLTRAGAGVDTAKLAGYLRTAGDRAMRAAAFADAVDHFSHAVALVEQGEAGQRAELLERLAMALRSVGRWDDTMQAMDQAVELYKALGRTDALGRLYGVMAYQLGWSARWQESFTVAQRGLAALGDLPSGDRARLMAAAAWVIGLSGEYATAAGMIGAARALAESLHDDRALADVLHLETFHCIGYAQFRRGIDAGTRAAAVFEANGALWDQASALSFAEYLAGTVVPAPEGGPAPGRAEPIAERLGHMGALFMTAANRARFIAAAVTTCCRCALANPT